MADGFGLAADERAELAWWRERLDLGPDQRPAADVDPRKLDSAGWGVVFPAAPRLGLDELEKQLAPLLQLRRAQATTKGSRLFRRLIYQRGDTKSTFMARHRVKQGPAHPDRLPYYLLLVGGLDEIPAGFQYLLDVQYAVGRIAFDNLEDYGAYAHSVVSVETEQSHRVKPELAFVSVRNGGDRATRLSDAHLVQPLREVLELDRPDWTITQSPGAKHDLLELFSGDRAPALLFTASHGLSYRCGHAEQRDRQGAILCREWPGHRHPVRADHRFCADDLGDDANVHGLVAFLFGCYSAGTPRDDNFPPPPLRNHRQVAPQPFVSKLAQRLLSHPRGSALAVLGHFDRTWTCSFGAGESRGARHIESMVKYLLDGFPVGHAMDWLNERHAELASELTEALDERREPVSGSVEDPLWLTHTWRAHADARNFVVLGDPAVRLPVGPRSALQQATALETSGQRYSLAALRQFLGGVSQEGVATSESPATVVRRLGGRGDG